MFFMCTPAFMNSSEANHEVNIFDLLGRFVGLVAVLKVRCSCPNSKSSEVDLP